MKATLLFLFLFSSAFAQTQQFSFSFVGKKRFYLVHLPKSLNKKQPASLVVALHGGGGNMNIQANDEYYKLISQSDKTGSILVFPNGFSRLPRGKFATWNAGTCCASARDNKSDDVGFIREVVKKVSNDNNIDKDKVFAIGMSNGGMMSYRLACEASDVFKAIAAVAGTDNTINCSPKKPVSILHIHALDDDHVLFNGGLGPKAISKKAETSFNSVDVTISKWIKFNQCSKQPSKVLSVKGAYCDLYSKCLSHSSVKLCVTEKGGHSWPGGKKPRGDQNSSMAISANDIIWDFFKI